MIVRVPDFPPLSPQGKLPRPLVMLIGQGEWQAKAAAELSPSCGCVVCSDAEPPGGKAFPALWIDAAIQYIETADVVGVWAGEKGLYLDEWTLSAFACGKRPQAVIAGSGLDPEHPMTPGFINLALQAGVPAFASYDVFTAALRNRARQSRGG